MVYTFYIIIYIFSKWYTCYPYLFVVIQLAPGSRQSTHPLGSTIKLNLYPDLYPYTVLHASKLIHPSI